MMNDPLANALCAIINAERTGKKEVFIRPISKIIKKVLKIMEEKGYIGSIGIKEDTRGGSAIVELAGRLNEARVIKPKFSVRVEELEKYEKRFLPAYNVGVIIIISTSKGIITHEEAKEKNVGGKLISFCY